MKEWTQIWAKPRSITDPEGNYNGFNPSVTTLKAGYCHPKGNIPLNCDVIWERDNAVVLRDGTTIYTDIYRPAVQEKVPVVISWSPYGKSNIDLPWAYDEGDLSHLQKEEGVDPAFWCAGGYAVAHPDARGAYMSGGNIYHWGTNEGRDIYDYIEWLAKQEWCNGSVGMAGNSYLTIAQWFAADQKPPHLKAIAPWEGQTDAYREVILRGGIVDNAFPRQAISVMHGNHYVDDMASMADEYQMMNSYWENKRAVLKEIEIPAYIVASYTNPIHTQGTFRAYRELSSKEKWLRIHNSTEWVDFYRPQNQKDLMTFFDYYLKGIENGWEKTPAVRYAVLNPGGEDAVDLIDEVFPPVGTQYQKLYLNCESMKLTEIIGRETSASYSGGDASAEILFRYTFQRDTDIIGYPDICLFVEAEGTNDMDIFVEIGKEGEPGRFLAWDCKPHNRYFQPFPAYEGRLRVSMRALDQEKTKDHLPVHSFEKAEYLEENVPVKVNISIRPMGLRFRAGETLLLRIGNEQSDVLAGGRKLGRANNGGIHRIHAGKNMPSYLELPFREVL
ncbi:MAG: CocE/NonD family hydrolase [Eubacteriales bacterium]|nr:CocE/NonD family hydrolase [Eubacteriales bacterium]